MQICIGMIGWQPSEFWNASTQEVWSAIDGFAEFNGDGKEKPMDRDELEEMMELYPD
jgi:hypothetical protein|tara:strand:+ start:487 stop:657 length:171 start_codon:yes stop_codon:yes gene_type:complete